MLSHIGLKCTVSDEKEFKKNRIRMADDETNNKIICNEKEIASVLGKLKTGVIDAWVAGHHHDTIHHFRDGVPII